MAKERESGKSGTHADCTTSNGKSCKHMQIVQQARVFLPLLPELVTSGRSVLPSLLWQAALRPRFLSSTFKALKLCAKFDNSDEEMQ